MYRATAVDLTVVLKTLEDSELPMPLRTNGLDSVAQISGV